MLACALFCVIFERIGLFVVFPKAYMVCCAFWWFYSNIPVFLSLFRFGVWAPNFTNMHKNCKCLIFLGYHRTEFAQLLLTQNVKCVSKGQEAWCFTLRKNKKNSMGTLKFKNFTTNSIRCGHLMLSTVMPLKMLKACHSSVNISESSFSHVYG